MREDGVTLTELLITVSIIGILAVALGFSFRGWMGNYRIENQDKDIYVDLMEAKTRAMTRSRAQFITLTSTQYTIQDDLDPWPNGNGTLTAGDNTRPPGYSEPIPLLQKTLNTSYQFRVVGAGTLPQTVTIDTRGLMSPEIDFRIDPGHPACCLTDTCSIVDKPKCFYPDFDCIKITRSRIKMGKYNGTTTVCEAK